MTADMRGALVLDLTEFLRSLGQDPATILAEAGLSATSIPDRDTRVPVEAPMELIELSARKAGMPDFGLRLAQFRGMPDLGPLALILRECRTLGDGLATIAQSFYLHSNAFYLSILDQGGTIQLAADLVTAGQGLSRQSAEMIVRGIFEMLRRLLGLEWKPVGITFRHSRALPVSTYRAHFGVDPEFGQEYNSVLLNRSDLARPLRMSAPSLDREAQAILDDAASAADVFLYRVRQLIVLTIQQGEARADRVASLLKIDRRTLHRRLGRCETTFSRVLHEVRLEFALQYVRGSDRSLSEITLLLGFESLAVFSRWFRNATGMSPSAYRASLRASSPVNSALMSRNVK